MQTSCHTSITFYSDDLPNFNIIDEELCHWKAKWLLVPKEDRPKSLAESMNNILCYNFPQYLHLPATLPLSSCSCERSGSICSKMIEQFSEMYSDCGEAECPSPYTYQL